MRMSVLIVAILVVSVLTACSSNQSTYKHRLPERVKPVTELNLNFPGSEQACFKPDLSEQSLLYQGLDSLEKGSYIEALRFFKRHLRTQKNSSAQLDARLAINYLIFIPASPVHDIKEAKKTYYELRRELTDDIALDRRVLLMREAMEAFLLLEKHISSLEDKNLQLQKNLRKRESALKRLRELALGS